MPNSVVHFEMPAKDKKRTADFYSKVFGWKMIMYDEKMGGYLLAQTTKTDKNGMVKGPGINGGFFDYENKEGFNSPHLVISVKNLKQSIDDVKKAGGQIISDIMDIPGIGKYTSIKDTEGNIVGMLQSL